MYVEKIGIYQIFQLVNIFEVVLFTYKFVHVSFFGGLQLFSIMR